MTTTRAFLGAAVIGALSSMIGLGASSVLPVTFNDLVTKADVIFVGSVVDVRSFPLTARDGLLIKTRVVFSVTDGVFGTSSAIEVFDFLGGEWNGERLQVADMPQFAVGDRRVVFARRDGSINPIVGFTQGLLRIERDDAGTDRVLTLGGLAIIRPDSIGTKSAVNLPRSSSMRLTDFRDQLGRAVAEAHKR